MFVVENFVGDVFGSCLGFWVGDVVFDIVVGKGELVLVVFVFVLVDYIVDVVWVRWVFDLVEYYLGDCNLIFFDFVVGFEVDCFGKVFLFF